MRTFDCILLAQSYGPLSWVSSYILSYIGLLAILNRFLMWTNLPTSEVRSRVTVAQGTALAASARAYHLPVGSSCLTMSTQYGAALPHRPAATGEQR